MTFLNITFGQRIYYSGENFLPIAAGGGREDILTDDKGDNIASKNEVFGELTAVYWTWKNLNDVDIIGMSHYRRYLMPKRGLLGGIIPYTKTFYHITWKDSSTADCEAKKAALMSIANTSSKCSSVASVSAAAGVTPA